MSDLPWRVVTVPWELKEVMLGWVSERVSSLKETPLPTSLASGLIGKYGCSPTFWVAGGFIF